MRPFNASTYPPAFRDEWFDRVADVPSNVRCTTPTLVNQGKLYADRVRWLAGDGAHLLRPSELSVVRAALADLEEFAPEATAP